MANQIEIIKPGVFFTKSRGSEITLTEINCPSSGRWQMETNNASQQAYRGLGIRYFDSLELVEKNYKSWQGIANLVSTSDVISANPPNSIVH
jgi:hypothetical protein